jgi:hypothetical protein
MLHGNCWQHKCMVRSEQPALFSERLIATCPLTGKQTGIVFYNLKRSLPVALIRINLFCKYERQRALLVIPTPNRSSRVAADLRLRPHGH